MEKKPIIIKKTSHFFILNFFFYLNYFIKTGLLYYIKNIFHYFDI